MSGSNGKILFGFIFGAAVGVAAGLLFAPTSGEETRKKITDKGKEYTDDLAEKLTTKIDEVKHYVGDMANDAKAQVRKAAPEKGAK